MKFLKILSLGLVIITVSVCARFVCKDRYFRMHVLPDNSTGWYLLIESSEGGKISLIDDHHQLIVFSSSRIAKIKEIYLADWGVDNFVTYQGDTVPSHPDIADDEIGVRFRGGGFVLHKNRKVSYQRFFVGTDRELRDSGIDGYKTILDLFIKNKSDRVDPLDLVQ